MATKTTNYLGGYTNTETELDFAGVAKLSKTYHKRLAGDTERVITETFEYDHQNRLLVHKHKVDNNPEEILAQNTYNDLSQLQSKKVGGTVSGSGLQTVDYLYNIRGWMTKINDPDNLGNDLFGYAIKYNNPENSGLAPGRFNGNIAEVDWNNAEENLLKRYNYEYDPLNRLKNAFYKEPSTGVNTSFDEYLSYDVNGNIITLKRYAPQVSSPTATKVDDLDYQYTGNRLTKITENAFNDTGYEGGNNMIDYDVNGSMLNMKDKGIQNIFYNYLNLPNMYFISQTDLSGAALNSDLNYLYRADGTKLRKTYNSTGPRGGTKTTNIIDYLDGFQYSNFTVTQCIWCRTDFAYEEQAFRRPINPGGNTPVYTLDFVNTAEGVYSFTENRYIYQYVDHLGNVRVNYAKDAQGNLEITNTNNYYAFGMNHIGGVKSMLGGYKNYKYNGKEIQETGMYDYGARFYMSDIGRWGVVDPLAEQYRRFSPYNYTVNNPINFTDPDGRWVRGAGFFNNLFKSDARIHAEQWADQLGSGYYNVTVNKGNNGSWNVTSHTLISSVKDTFNSEGLTNTLYIPYSQGGGLGTAPSSGDPWAPKFSSVPESRGKTEIQTQVAENPLIQGVAIGLLTEGIANTFIKAATTTVTEESTIGLKFNITTNTASKANIVFDSGSASDLYKALNPKWTGEMTKVTSEYSTTSFGMENRTKVFLSSGSKSTGMPSVKIVSKNYQLLLRFPNQ